MNFLLMSEALVGTGMEGMAHFPKPSRQQHEL